MKLAYVNMVYEPEAAEFDAADYPHQFCEPDGTPIVLISDVSEVTLTLIKDFLLSLELTDGS